MKRTWLTLCFCIACGDDTTPTDAAATVDGAFQDSAFEDSAFQDSALGDSALGDSSTDSGEVDAGLSDVGVGDSPTAFMDVPPDVFDTGPRVDDTIYFEVLREFSVEDWLRGVSLTQPVTLAAQLDLVELRAVRDFPGEIFLRRRGDGPIEFGFVAPVYVSSGALARRL